MPARETDNDRVTRFTNRPVVFGRGRRRPGIGAVTPIANRNSFRIGDLGVLCTAQSRPQDQRLKGISTAPMR